MCVAAIPHDLGEILLQNTFGRQGGILHVHGQFAELQGHREVRVWHMARSMCVVFFGKTLYSQSAFPHPEVKMGTCKLSGKPDWMLPPGGSSDTFNQFML